MGVTLPHERRSSFRERNNDIEKNGRPTLDDSALDDARKSQARGASRIFTESPDQKENRLMRTVAKANPNYAQLDDKNKWQAIKATLDKSDVKFLEDRSSGKGHSSDNRHQTQQKGHAADASGNREQHKSPQEVINKYFRAAHTKDFSTAQNYAKKIGELDQFNAAIKARDNGVESIAVSPANRNTPYAGARVEVDTGTGLLTNSKKVELVGERKDGSKETLGSAKRVSFLHDKLEIYENVSGNNGDKRIEILGIPVFRRGEQSGNAEYLRDVVDKSKTQRHLVGMEPKETSATASTPDSGRTPQQIINSYYHAAGVTGRERNLDSGFTKAQAHAAKMGAENLKEFNAAVAARRNSN